MLSSLQGGHFKAVTYKTVMQLSGVQTFTHQQTFLHACSTGGNMVDAGATSVTDAFPALRGLPDLQETQAWIKHLGDLLFHSA